MIGLDTNILVRYITQDDEKQSLLANSLIDSLDESSPGYVTLATVAELNWVFESVYGVTRPQFVQVMQTLMSLDNIKLDRVAVVASAVRIYASSKADFSDCLIERLCSSAGCSKTMTFDRGAAKMAGMQLLA